MNHPRLQRERRTLHAMLELYCRAHHGASSLCPDCRALFAYAIQRIEKCPYQADKPTCASCPIHCYKPAMREQVRQVMRYAGPRMLFRHPVLTLYHTFDGMKKPRTPLKARV